MDEIRTYYDNQGNYKGISFNWGALAQLLIGLCWVTVFLWGAFLAVGYPILYYLVKQAPDTYEYSYSKYKIAYNFTYECWVLCWLIIIFCE